MSKPITHRIAPPGCLPTDATMCRTERRDGSELVTTEDAQVTCPRCLEEMASRAARQGARLPRGTVRVRF